MTRRYLSGYRAAISIAALFCTVPACDERKTPIAPVVHAAAILVDEGTTTASPPRCCTRGLTAYRVSFALREINGVAATIASVTTRVTETSGASTADELSVQDLFGTTRIAANGTLVATNVSFTRPLETVSEMIVRATFNDENGNTGSAQTSIGLKLDLSGDWTGPLPIRSDPVGDWSLARASLVQSADAITGELISRDSVHIPLERGTVSAEGPPMLSIRGLTISPCGGTLSMSQIDFGRGRVERLSGHATGRCYGTFFGDFELQRGT